MQVVILCGGKGTRAYPYTQEIPKPLLPVAACPILIHVMRLFSRQGHRDFILSLGHLKESIIDYFATSSHRHEFGELELVDTGAETDTAGRILRCQHLLGDQFLATYADGLCDVPLDGLLDFHQAHGGLATLTTVPLPSQYGTVDGDEHGQVHAFREKPELQDYWINSGFFVFDKRVFEFWEGDNLEREVFPSLARRGLLYMYRHRGVFRSMDTYKDQQDLERIYREQAVSAISRRLFQPGARMPQQLTLESSEETAGSCSGTTKASC